MNEYKIVSRYSGGKRQHQVQKDGRAAVSPWYDDIEEAQACLDNYLNGEMDEDSDDEGEE